jgi:hypothetical protein
MISIDNFIPLFIAGAAYFVLLFVFNLRKPKTQ